MEINLNHRWARIMFFAAVVVCSGTLTLAGARAYLAARWNASGKPELWLKAARLEPGNAEYWAHVGLSRQWDLTAEGSRDAVSYVRQATQINPWSADLWMELADAYQTSGDLDHAQQAFERARASYPMSAEVAWRYGSFLLYHGDFAEGYGELRRAVSIDASLTERAMAECWESNPSVAPILNQVLPRRADNYLRAMNYFLSQNLPSPALAVWNRQRELGLPIRMADSTLLVDTLIEGDRIVEAQQTWHEALEAANWPQDRGNGESLVLNGGFEHDIANGGFDWREVEGSGAQFDFDGTVAHSGSRSMRIEFDGLANLDFEHLFQFVTVQPASRYHFSAYLRTEGVSTDRGMRFAIFDPRHPSQVQAVTAEVRGTNPWTLVQADIVTASETRFLRITLQRVPSWKFDNKLRGTVWVDDVALTRVPTQVKDSSG